MDRTLRKRLVVPTLLMAGVALASCGAVEEALGQALTPEIDSSWCTTADEELAQELLDYYFDGYAGFRTEAECPTYVQEDSERDGNYELFTSLAGFISLPEVDGVTISAEVMDREVGDSVNVMVIASVLTDGSIDDYVPVTDAAADRFLEYVLG